MFNMEKIKVRAELDECELNHIMLQYHFQSEDKGKICSVYDAMKRLACPVLYIKIAGKAEKEKLPYIKLPEYVLVLATLGHPADELEEGYIKSEDLKNAYIAECLSMELLKKTYESMEKAVLEKWGLWVGEYQFPGDKIPLEYIRELFSLLPQKQLAYNEAYVLKPSKSAAFIAELSRSPFERKASICENCSNANCMNRRNKNSGKEKNYREGLDQISLNYGFQRIFGRERED